MSTTTSRPVTTPAQASTNRVVRFEAKLIFFLAALLLARSAAARDFIFGPVEGLLDITAAYGLAVRVEDRDEDLIAVANGGNGSDANIDDGTLNYGTGVASNMVRASGRLVLAWESMGLFLRGAAYYDHENQNNDRARTDFSSEAKDLVGSDIELQENYLSFRFLGAGMPMHFRVGDQIINWGESTFVRGGVDIINPVDLVAVSQPASLARDLRIPQGMVWGAANVSETLAVEAYYQYEWKKVRFPPVGGYLSVNDLLGGDGLNFAMLGGGQISDLGTQLDALLELPLGTLGFDEDFMKIPGLREETPNDGGQYGLTLLAVFPYANGIKAALHYIRYHSRLPLINGLTGDALAVAGTSPPAVAARAAQLQPVYESQGLSPEDAAMAALDAAEQLTLSGYANQSGYFVEYPEDIEMFAFTFNTATPRTGTLFSGEIAHHLDYPFQVSLNTVLNAVLSPVLYDPEIGDTVLGEFGPDEIVPGVVELDRTQISLEIGQVFGPRLGAAQTVLTGDLAWVHLHDMPSNNDLPLQAPGGADGDSWGYKLSAALQYSGIFGELNLTPRIIWTHDVKGTTPAPLSTFVEDRKSFSIGVFGTYVTRWSADLSYTAFFGGGRDNLLNDRDFIRFQLTYSF